MGTKRTQSISIVGARTVLPLDAARSSIIKAASSIGTTSAALTAFGFGISTKVPVNFKMAIPSPGRTAPGITGPHEVSTPISPAISEGCWILMISGVKVLS